MSRERDCVVTVKPIDDNYLYHYVDGIVKQGSVIDSSKGFSDYEDEDVDHSLVDGWSEDDRIDNYRRYMPLAEPILNEFLAGKGGSEIFRILGVDSNLKDTIMSFSVIYDTETNKYIDRRKIDNVPWKSSYLVGPKIVEYMIDNWDKETATVKCMERILRETCFKDKAPEIGTIGLEQRGIELINGYYFYDICTGALKTSVDMEMIQPLFYKAATRGCGSLQYCLNTTKERLKAVIMHNLVIVPYSMRLSVDNRVHSLTKQYKEVRKASNELASRMTFTNLSVRDYIVPYKKLNDTANFLLKAHDDVRASKSVALGERLSGKKKLIRGNMLSKRSDYTGRSVVVCNPDLKLTQIALPDTILSRVLSHEFVERAGNFDVTHLLTKLPCKEIVDMMEEKGILDNKTAVLNRAPTLHKLSMVAYDVVRSHSNAIEVNTLLNVGFNMDHDGDTAAVKIAITVGGIDEVKGLLHAKHNLFKPSSGECTLAPRLEMLYGLSKLTDISYRLSDPVYETDNPQEVEDLIYRERLNVWDTITYCGENRIAGQVFAESLLPRSVYDCSYTINGDTITDVVEGLVAIQDNDTLLDSLWKLSKVGFDMSKIYPPKATLITNMDKEYRDKPFKVFHKALKEMDDVDSLGFYTPDSYLNDFNDELDKLKEVVDQSVDECINGCHNGPEVLMLNGLYMSTKDSFILDTVSDDDELTDIDSYDQLRHLVVNMLIRVHDTVLYKGERCLAGRKLVEETAHKKLLHEVDASNIDEIFNDDIRVLGLQLANLYSDIDIDKKIQDYSTGILSDVVTSAYYLTRDGREIDLMSLDDDVPKYSSIDDLKDDLLHKRIEPDDTVVIEGKLDRYLAGRALVSSVIGKDVIREICNESYVYFDCEELRELGREFSSIYPSEERFHYVPESYRDGSRTVSQPNGFVDIVRTGSRGKTSNLVQIFMDKGQISKASGEAFSAIVENSFSTQLTPLEHDIAAYGSRKGVIKKSICPRDTGYLERLLWHTPQDVIITEDDCGTTDGLELSLDYIVSEKKDINKDMGARILDARDTLSKILVGRYIVGRDDMLTKDTAKQLVAELGHSDIIKLRSPITCKNPCCAKCYGMDLSDRGKAVPGTPVGFIASESIGEPGTQLTLKAFQKGGVASRNESTLSESDRLSAKFNLSSIANAATHPEYDPIAWATGKVHVKPKDTDYNIVTIEGSSRKVKLRSDIRVFDNVKKGTPMCRIPGDQDIIEKEIFSSVLEAQKLIVVSSYLIFENVANVNMKHFEVIASAMKMRIVLKYTGKNDNIKLLQPYTMTEWRDKGIDIKDCVYKDILVGVKKQPILRESCISNFLMENVALGVRRALFLGNEDKLDNPFNSTIMGLHPNIGTQYNPNYIKERCYHEEDRLRR